MIIITAAFENPDMRLWKVTIIKIKWFYTNIWIWHTFEVANAISYLNLTHCEINGWMAFFNLTISHF